MSDAPGAVGTRFHKYWKPAAGAIVVAAILGGFAAAWLHDHRLQRAMVMADPDTIPASAPLLHFALKQGRTVYQEHCAACHGADGAGDTGKGVPSFADADWLYGSSHAGDIEWTISRGIRADDPRGRNLTLMPAYATPRPSPTEDIPPLSPADLGDVTEYVFSIGKHQADPDAAARGGAIFRGRGGCFDCHGADAAGDPAVGAPNLTDDIWLSGDGSREAISSTIAHGMRGMCPAWGKVLKASQVRAVTIFVQSLSQARTDKRNDTAR